MKLSFRRLICLAAGIAILLLSTIATVISPPPAYALVFTLDHHEQRHFNLHLRSLGQFRSDVFAVGKRHYPALQRQCLEHHDKPHRDSLYGVWGSSGSDVFAVGDGGTILHYDGSAWSTMTSSATGYLFSVWGTSHNNVWAVGWDGGPTARSGTMTAAHGAR